MSYYAVKFEREAKENPKDWVIVPDRNGYHLEYIGL